MSVLKSIQQQVADALVADPRFALVKVLTENIKDIDNEMEISLGPEPVVSGGPYGIVALVLTPTADVSWANVPGPYFDKINVVVDIWENVITNRAPGGTQLACQDAIEAACNIIHQSYPTACNAPIVSVSPSIRIVPDPDFLRYQARFITQAGMQATPPQIFAPTSIVNTGVYTLACATTGAAMFYTVDGTNPGPRGATSNLYTAPITVAPGNTILVKAWLAGYTASDVTKILT